jgi:hypothetical protein
METRSPFLLVQKLIENERLETLKLLQENIEKTLLVIGNDFLIELY